jgi:hypothetical protein
MTRGVTNEARSAKHGIFVLASTRKGDGQEPWTPESAIGVRHLYDPSR